jgi:hypothetical protein
LHLRHWSGYSRTASHDGSATAEQLKTNFRLNRAILKIGEGVGDDVQALLGVQLKQLSRVETKGANSIACLTGADLGAVEN